MKIIFDEEVGALNLALKNADGYLQCEAIILKNIKKHAEKNNSTTSIEPYLKKLYGYYEDKKVGKNNYDNIINYKYAAAFLYNIITTPYWHSWIKNTNW